MNLPQTLRKDLIDTIFSQGIECVRVVSGGDINQAAVVSAVDGASYFVKWNCTASQGFFEAEVAGLKELAAPGVIQVPRVIHCGGDRTPPFLVLELLAPGKRDSVSEEQLGERLAQLHLTTRDEFGFPEDNFIGWTPQLNSSASNWGEFFVRQRLQAQADVGLDRGWLTRKTAQLLTEMESALCDALNAPDEPPALLHGDLWGGNVFWSAEGPALIDPAVYYGNREADIAFTELFGGFGQPFYAAYENTWPLTPGYKDRKEILNLYHIMNHANQFGGSYISSVNQIVHRLGQKV